MGTFTSVSLYDRGSTRPVSGRTVRVTSWPDGGPVATDPPVLTTDYYGATPEFTVDGVDAVIVTAGKARRVLVSIEKQLDAAPELPPSADDGQVLTWDASSGEWVARSGTSGTVTSVNGVEPDASGNVVIEAGGVDIRVGGTAPGSGWWLDTGQMPPDATAPTPPTGLSATATGPTTVHLSWSASTDNVGVTGYEYRIGTGVAVDAGAGLTETVGGLTASTAYSFQVRAYDAAGNRSGWSTAANATTLSGPDVTPPTGGTLTVTGSGPAGSTRTLTVSGATDAGSGLHAQPYRFSTDGGSTWSTYQESNVFETATLAVATYSPRAQVRDAAPTPNVVTLSAADFTVSPGPITDTFSRTASGAWGTSDSGHTWVSGVSGGTATLDGSTATLSGGARRLINADTYNVDVTVDLVSHLDPPDGSNVSGVYVGEGHVNPSTNPTCYLRVHPSNSGNFVAAKWDNGTWSASWKSTPDNVHDGAGVGTLRVVLTSGDGTNFNLKVYWNGALAGDWSGTMSVPLGTYVGLGTNSAATNHVFDNFIAQGV